jgi:hypothetical protein
MAGEQVHNYEVVIVYKGQDTYYVQATSEEEAERLAGIKYADGAVGESSADYQDVENIVIHKIERKEANV